MELLNHLRRQLGRAPSMRVLRAPRFRDIVRELVADDEGIPQAHHTTGRTVVRLRRSGERRLWCFLPPLSGAVTRYAAMARLLPVSEAVWACETPAELSDSGMEGLTKGIAEALLAEGVGGFERIVLTGYSLGGVFALEVARQLLTAGGLEGRIEVLLLDPPNPEDPQLDVADAFDVFVRVGWRIADAESADFVDADGRYDLAGVARAARRAGTLPQDAADTEISDAWRSYEANARILVDYRLHRLSGAPLALLRCQDRQPGPGGRVRALAVGGADRGVDASGRPGPDLEPAGGALRHAGGPQRRHGRRLAGGHRGRPGRSAGAGPVSDSLLDADAAVPAAAASPEREREPGPDPEPTPGSASRLGWLTDLAAAGPRGLLARQALTSSVGIFLALSVTALYLVGPGRLGDAASATTLAAASVASLVVTVPVGRLIRRIGPRGFALLSTYVRAALFALLPFVSVRWGLEALVVAIGVAETAAFGVYQIIIAETVGESARAKAVAARRALGNLGFSVAAGLTAVVVGIGTHAAYTSAFLVSAGALAVSGWYIHALPRTRPGRPEPEPEPGHTGGTARSALRDPRYAALILVAAVLATSLSLLTVGVPLWVVSHTRAPHALVGVLMAVNTGLVVVFQVRVAAGAENLPGARRAVVAAGAGFAAAAAAYALAGHGGAPAAVATLLLGTVLASFAEMYDSAAWWTISYQLAPRPTGASTWPRSTR
ncbi:MFS transporter [Streptacidiphilus sp. 4-A2]|nr:MFS transporter [Streptacidiphilus sp. 4-A2]